MSFWQHAVRKAGFAGLYFPVMGSGMSDVQGEDEYSGKLKDIGIAIADHVDAMLAYWDKDLVCRFANRAYWQWFGKRPEEMIDRITIQELLGPLYWKSLPYIEGVLKGTAQTFEREIKTPTGEVRYSLAN